MQDQEERKSLMSNEEQMVMGQPSSERNGPNTPKNKGEDDHFVIEVENSDKSFDAEGSNT